MEFRLYNNETDSYICKNGKKITYKRIDVFKCKYIIQKFYDYKKILTSIMAFVTALFVLFILTSCVNNSEISVSSLTNKVRTRPSPLPTNAPVKSKIVYYQFQPEAEIRELSASEVESADLSTEIVSVSIEYYDDSCYIVKVNWLSQPEYSKKLNILIDNVISDSFEGVVKYNTVCKGVSDLFDLNHVYRNNESYSLEELEIISENIMTLALCLVLMLRKGFLSILFWICYVK